MIQKKQWHIIATRIYCETKVSELLERKKISSFCPLCKVQKQLWSEPGKPVQVPVFSSCVFVHISEGEFNIVRNTHGVLNFLYWLNRPVVVSDEDIQAIRAFSCLYDNIEIERVPIKRTDGQIMADTDELPEMGKTGDTRTDKLFLPTLGLFMIASIPETGPKERVRFYADEGKVEQESYYLS